MWLVRLISSDMSHFVVAYKSLTSPACLANQHMYKIFNPSKQLLLTAPIDSPRYLLYPDAVFLTYWEQQRHLRRGQVFVVAAVSPVTSSQRLATFVV
ncbi:hypothetical protein E2C01_002319 [Portunus trituberculatus]|uniref:Uncharacterized protein n=1 Tax=Portunus trituberculatus TaxID=210409 RepID=A0A5B7CLM8_PORTR|nr:hypothetical protein [Portunus trituberculatus]